MTSTQIGLFVFFSFFIVGGIGSLLLQKKETLANLWSGIFVILGSLFGIGLSFFLWNQHQILSFTAYASPLSALSFSFLIDPLSLFFIFLMCLIALFCALFGIRYVHHFFGQYNIGVLGFLFNFFLLGMLGVVTSGNAIFFLLSWETMAITSFFLILYEYKKRENVRAGFMYLTMTQIGTAAILAAFLLLYATIGSFDFETIRAHAGTMPLLFKNLAFILLFIGLGTKSGVIPFHIWLPGAHPAAPSHVSALLSGVMIKTGIYMMIRMFIDILGPIPTWWGLIVLIAGSLSAIIGVLYALTEHDLKKLLAYHSIENIGIILLGLGSALVFLSLGFSELALIGIIAALFHTINHAIFKSLLFLGAGAVIEQTHTRNMEKYGGLIKYMPQTAFFFLIGSMAISALPPFNGFFSEWFTFQSLFQGIALLDFSQKWVFILAAGSLAFTGGLALACFVKAFGITFLARPRSHVVKNAQEVSWSQRLGMGGLALLAILFGLFSTPLVALLTTLGKSLAPFQDIETKTLLPATTLTQNTVSGFGITFLLLSALLVTVLAVLYGISRKQKIVSQSTWDCGTNLTPRMEITATGFSRSIITIFRGILRPSMQNTIEYNDADSRYLSKSHTITLETSDITKKYAYTPAYQLLLRLSEKTKKIQNGNVNLYILYIFLTLILTLILTLT